MQDSRTVQTIGAINPTDNGFAIQLDATYREALIGLSDFSHAIILWWAHRADDSDHRERLTYEKPYQKSADDWGVFATRSPSRPNPIGLSLVALQDVDIPQGVISVPFIDAEPGTPIIDVKPYFPSSDRVRDVTTPAWCQHWPQYYEDSATFNWMEEFT